MTSLLPHWSGHKGRPSGSDNYTISEGSIASKFLNPLDISEFSQLLPKPIGKRSRRYPSFGVIAHHLEGRAWLVLGETRQISIQWHAVVIPHQLGDYQYQSNGEANTDHYE